MNFVYLVQYEVLELLVDLLTAILMNYLLMESCD